MTTWSLKRSAAPDEEATGLPIPITPAAVFPLKRREAVFLLMTSSYAEDHRIELEKQVKMLTRELFRLKMTGVPKGNGMKKKLHLPDLTS